MTSRDAVENPSKKNLTAETARLPKQSGGRSLRFRLFNCASIVLLTLLLSVSSLGELIAQALPYENSRFGIFGAYAANEYGYFKTRMGFTDTRYWNWVNGHFQNLGAHWTRSNLQLVWDKIEPVLDSAYNWNPQPFMTDSVIINVYKTGNQIHWLGVFHEGSLFPRTPPPPNPLRDPLGDTVRYKRFVQNVVERYSGDGYQDVNPYVKVRYWQIGNEIPPAATDSMRMNYVKWVKITSRAIHSADSSAKIVLIAQTQGFSLEPWLRAVILALGNNNYFKVIDIHHWGNASNYKMIAVRQTRLLLDSIGMTQSQIWSCENGTWAYQPTNQPYQTQQQQTRSLVQRSVYNIDLGINKLFWNNLVEFLDFGGNQGSIFNSMGLIGDGMRNGEPPQNFNQPRVSYFAYKLLAATIDVDKARYAGKMGVHQEPNLYAYRYVSLSSDSVARYILWRDSGSQSVTFRINTPRALVTNMITDSLGNILQRDTVTADVQGNITFNVGIDPLLVKEIPSTTSVEDEGENIPKEFLLDQNYPNPFNPTTTIRFTLQVSSFTSLKVYDVLGREVATLVNGELDAGEHSVVFDAAGLPSGVYVYRLSAGTFVQQKKMVVMR